MKWTAATLLSIALVNPLSSFSQVCPPNIQSQRATPEIDSFTPRTHTLTSDNGYLIGGYSYFPSYGYGDFYILRLNANLEKLWEASYGGDNSDEILAVHQAAD